MALAAITPILPRDSRTKTAIHGIFVMRWGDWRERDEDPLLIGENMYQELLSTIFLPSVPSSVLALDSGIDSPVIARRLAIVL